MDSVFMAAFVDELDKIGAFGMLGSLDQGMHQSKSRKGWLGAPGDPMRTNIKQKATTPTRAPMKQPAAFPKARLGR